MLEGQDVKWKEAGRENEAIRLDVESRSWVGAKSTRAILSYCECDRPGVNARQKPKLHFKADQ